MTFGPKLAGLFAGCVVLSALNGCGMFMARSAVSSDFDSGRVGPIAILVEDASGGPASAALYRQVEIEFIHTLMSKGYTVASRSDVHHLVTEGEFQRESALTDGDAARLGRMLNVPTILIATITGTNVTSERRLRTVRTSGGHEYQQRYTAYIGHASLGGRLVHVETGQVLWTSSDTNHRTLDNNQRHVAPAVQYVASRVAMAFPDRDAGTAE